jgi:hypothetical protein
MNELLMLGGSILVTLVIAPFIHSGATDIFRWVKFLVSGSIDKWLKDDKLRADFNAKCLEAQKLLVEQGAVAKTEFVKNWLKIAIPGLVDDIIIDQIFEAFYNEFLAVTAQGKPA